MDVGRVVDVGNSLEVHLIAPDGCGLAKGKLAIQLGHLKTGVGIG